MIFLPAHLGGSFVTGAFKSNVRHMANKEEGWRRLILAQGKYTRLRAYTGSNGFSSHPSKSVTQKIEPNNQIDCTNWLDGIIKILKMQYNFF